MGFEWLDRKTGRVHRMGDDVRCTECQTLRAKNAQLERDLKFQTLRADMHSKSVEKANDDIADLQRQITALYASRGVR